jgi:hypothetical protein
MTGQQLFVNAGSGVDTNPGWQEQPLRPVAEAVRRINGDSTSKSSEVIVAPGLYVLSKRHCSRTARLFADPDAAKTYIGPDPALRVEGKRPGPHVHDFGSSALLGACIGMTADALRHRARTRER